MAPVVSFSLRIGKGKEVRLRYVRVGESDETPIGSQGKAGVAKDKSGKGSAGTDIFLFKHKERSVGVAWGWNLWCVYLIETPFD